MYSAWSKVRITSYNVCYTKLLRPTLREKGLLFVGLDVIGDYLTEINVTSPTGIREVKRFGGADIAALVWDAVEARRGSAVDIVITSYSIHYTKLYEAFGRPNCVS